MYGFYYSNQEQNYTIGYDLRLRSSTKGSADLHYKYIVNGVEYQNYVVGDNRINDKFIRGNRYLIQFAVDDPSVSKLLIDRVVPKGINVPKEGWDTPPEILW